jgi:hypothetical protein
VKYQGSNAAITRMESGLTMDGPRDDEDVSSGHLGRQLEGTCYKMAAQCSQSVSLLPLKVLPSMVSVDRVVVSLCW